MTLEETAKVLTMMAVVYPDTDKDKSDEEIRMKVRVWQRLFSEEPMRLVTAALEAYMTTPAKFAPKPGELKDMIQRLTQGNELTEAEAWSAVAKALKNSAYNHEEEYQKLPAIVQRIVGSPSQLHEWALMDAETVQSVVASNFQRSYRARAAGDREIQRLPASVKTLIGNVSEALRLGDGGMT